MLGMSGAIWVMRTLIVISIVHTEQDMGSLLEQTRLAYVSKYGQAMTSCWSRPTRRILWRIVWTAWYCPII